jgi:hypothetical protein
LKHLVFENPDWKLKTCLPDSDDCFPRLEVIQPFYTGKEVVATEGHVMAVFPHKDKKLKVGFINKVKTAKTNPFPIKKTRAILKAKKNFTFSFDVSLLVRLMDSVGFNPNELGQRFVTFELDTKCKPTEYRPIKVRRSKLMKNKAYGILMPSRTDTPY